MRYRAIVADDERRARSAIVKQAEWERHGIELIAEAQNGDELLEAVERERPDLVLSDMRMPGLHGAELIRTLRERYPHIQLIIISGYDDFAYMKQAITSRIVDYLLKPIRPEALHDALAQAVRELNARRQEQERSLHVQQRLNESLPLLSEDLFHQWMVGSTTSEEGLLRSLGLPDRPQEAEYTAVACVMDNFAEVADNRFHANPHLLLYALVNMVNELLAGLGRCFRSRQQDSELILIMYRGLGHQELGELLDRLGGELKELLGITVLIGVGESRTRPHQTRDSLKEARAALSWLHAGQLENRTAFYALLQSTARATHHQAGSIERRLSSAIDSGSLAFIRQTVEEVYDEAGGAAGMSLASIRKLNADLLYQLERLVDQMEDQRAYLAELAALRLAVGSELNVPFVRRCVLKFLESVSRLEIKQRKERKVIYDIRDYLEQEYARKHSLKELSDRFYLSKEYISKMFKEEFGANLFVYLAELKIERAKRLLTGSEVKLRQIVDELGFNDESHFSKTFKKHTGYSPRSYRDQFRLF